MGRPLIDLTGRTFGRLLVIARCENLFANPLASWPAGRRGMTAWLCRCSCGKEHKAPAANLVKGTSTSCGCYIREVFLAAATKHGGTGTRAFKAWDRAKRRCYDVKRDSYKSYGGRGIKMCRRWRHDFAAFREDMGECPPGYTIERIDPNGHYEPGNCRWATNAEQQKNRRRTIRLTAYGRTQTMAEWCREFGIDYRTAFHAIQYRGRSLEWLVSRHQARH